MAGLASRLRSAFGFDAARKRSQARLEGLEARSTNPTQAEKVVVRPDRKVKKKIVK
jgi:hypothetical protein